MNKRIISFILAFIMIFATGLDALAVGEPTAPSTPVSGELIELGETNDGKLILGTRPREIKEELFNNSNSDGLEFGDERVGTPVRGTGDSMDQKVIVNLKRIGLNGLDTDTSNDNTFDDTAVNYPLAIDVYFQDAPAKGTVTFGNTDTRQEITIQIPSSGYQNLDDFYLMVPKADAVDGADYAIRADYSHGTPEAGKADKAITINLDLIELPETKMSVKYQDPYGNELTKGLPSTSPVAKLHLAQDYSFELGKTSKDKTRNEFYKIIEALTPDNSRSQINSIGTDPKLSIDDEAADGKLTIGADEFKVIKKEYTTSKGGDIVIQSQPKVLVPTPKINSDGTVTLPTKPEGYARLTFKADEAATDGVKGTFDENNQKDKERVVDVKVGTSYDDKDVKDAIAGIKNPQAIDTKLNKVFEKWNPETSTLSGNAVLNEDKGFNATYTDKYTKDEIIPFLPNETVPDKGSDGKLIPADYIIATFQAEKDASDKALGKVTVGAKTGEAVVAKVKPGVNLSEYFKTKTQTTAKTPEIKVTPNTNYGFTKWDPQLGKVQSVNPYVAKFVKDGQEIKEDDSVPEGWHKVTVKQDATIKAGTVPTKYYAVAPNSKLTTANAFPDLTNKAANGYKDPAWYVDGTKVENLAEKEITGDTTFIAKAVQKLVTPVDPSNPNPGTDEVTVTFLQGANGTLTGIDKTGKKVTGVAKLSYNVKNTATWADFKAYVPTIVPTDASKFAADGWKDKDKKAVTLPLADNTPIAANEYTAQYKNKLVTPVDPSNPNPGTDEVTVTFLQGANGTLTGIDKTGKKVTGVAKLSYNVKNTATWADFKAYVPTIVPTDASKFAADGWKDKDKKAVTLPLADNTPIAANEYTAQYKNKLVTPVDPSNPNPGTDEVTVTFLQGANGTLTGIDKTGKKVTGVAKLSYNVKNTATWADFKAYVPTIVPTDASKFAADGWKDKDKKAVTLPLADNTPIAANEYTAQYKNKLVTPVDPSNPNPGTDEVTVTFLQGANGTLTGIDKTGKKVTGVAKLSYNVKNTATWADFKAYVPTIVPTDASKFAADGWKDKDKKAVTLPLADNTPIAANEYTAQYKNKLVTPVDPSNPNPGTDEVTVTFLQGANGTLTGIDKTGKKVTGVAKLSYNVKNTATWADFKAYVPTIVPTDASKFAADGWKDKDKKAVTLPLADNTPIAANEYTAQYKNKLVTPVDPSNPNPGTDEVTVTFLQGANGTLTGIDKTGKKVTGVAKLSYNVKNTATWADFKAYVPTIVPTDASKFAADGWKDKDKKAVTLPLADNTPIAANEYTAQYKNKLVTPVDPSNPNPGTDEVTVTFLQGANGTLTGIDKTGKKVTGVAKLSYNVKNTATWADFKAYVPTIVPTDASKLSADGWKDKDKKAVTLPLADNTPIAANEYTAQYKNKLVTPVDPSNPNPGTDEVTVTFLQGANGTLTGIDKTGKKVTGVAKLSYNVKNTATWADFKAYVPTIVPTDASKFAADGWKDKDKKAVTLPLADNTPIAANEYTAQYKNKLVTPVDPSNPNPGTDEVTVTFLQGANGTLTGIDKTGKKVTGVAKLSYNVKNTATWADFKAYVPTIVPTDASKFAADGWKDKDKKAVTLPLADNTPIAANEYTAQYKNKLVTNKTTVEGIPTEVNPTADAQETGLIVKNQDATTPTTVTAVDEDGTTVTATIDPATGKIKVTPGTNVDGPITLTVKDDDFKDATNTTGEKKFIIPVKGHAAGRDDNGNGYPSYDYLTLTLDENYRSGDISHYDVYVGGLIERYLYTPRRRGYVFEGWSYNSRRLDEVRPGDRIYYSTTLYAIWSKQKAKDDEEVEPIDTREVGTHNAYMFGYTDGTVRPNGKITRAEAAALVTRLLDIEAYASDVKPNFPDTPSGWYNKAINAAVARGIMKGYPDGTFRPNAPITRAEFTQMISTIDNKPYGVAPFADVIGHWAERAIGAEYQAGRINGYPDGTFRPDAHITRAEAVVILNKIFDRNYDAASALQTPTKANIKMFSDLFTSFWGYNDMVEATNTHSFKRRVKGSVQEDWVEVK